MYVRMECDDVECTMKNEDNMNRREQKAGYRTQNT
jgi:hypothetical protein